MKNIILFFILSIPVIIISWRSLVKVNSHGFYRFFAWECILWLFVANYRYWFKDPFGIMQNVSWLLLILAAYLVIAGVFEMKIAGKAAKTRKAKELYAFEKTTELVDTGIFRYIRHPLYASLIYLTWGIFFKRPTIVLFMVAVISSALLFITARYDEKECKAFFGDKYRQYMTRSKMFVPFIV